MNEEKKYTLAEAKLELNKEECRLLGHDYQIIEEIGKDGPQVITCKRCGRSWNIAP
jgi:hypothetical protein